jgi:catechol 2,3-dioxygenase-like lactoylglutathione lyase family enzyme
VFAAEIDAMAEAPLAAMRIHHFGLRVADAKACRDWYVDTFGFASRLEFSANGLDFVLLSLPGDGGAVLEFVGGGPASRPSSSEDLKHLTQLGAAHVSLEVPDLDAAMAGVRARNIRVVMDSMAAAPGTGATRIAFIGDPWGNIVELIELSPR